METTLSSKGQLVLPAEVRRKLRLSKGERMNVEIREGGVFLRANREMRRYRLRKNSVSGLSVMVPIKATGRKVTAAEIAQLNADLL
ncbi:MAG: AbrB/MazE/SpoVT family DNA-binding domain-containing protein [Opitutaceae bacterium]|jgi:AbrB family looped-hinge helix DNA binding protein